MDVVWYCTVKRVSSMGLALSTSFRLKMLIVTWAFVSCPAPDRPTQSRPIVAMIVSRSVGFRSYLSRM